MSEKTLLIDQYILEAPQQCLKNIENSYELTRPLVEEFLSRPYSSVTVIASGSSYNGSVCAAPFMQEYLKCPVRVLTPFTFEYYENGHFPNSFPFVISQSGISTNALSALNKIREMGGKAIGLTGNLGNDFKDYADLEIDYGVCGEVEPYVTKGVTTLALFLMLFSLEAALAKNLIDQNAYLESKRQLRMAIDTYQVVSEKTPSFIDRHIKVLSSLGTTYLCAAGSAMGAAQEGALKFSELLKIPGIPLETEEYIHGYNYQLSPEHTVFLLDTFPETSERITNIYLATRKVTDRTFMITSNPDFAEDENVIFLSEVPDQLVSCLYCLPFFQWIAYQITMYKNCLLQHPLLKEFNSIVSSKSEKYAKDYIRRLNCDFH